MVQVSQLIQGCNTGLIQGLSLQVLDKITQQNDSSGVAILSRIDHPLITCEGRHNNPYLQTGALKALVQAVEERGIALHINSCLRTPMQQFMLRRQFEQGICGIRAAAPPPKSNHNSGLAIDIQDSVGWRSFLQNHQWRFIGNFDPVHYDYIGGGQDLGTLQVKVFQELWNEFNPGDLIAADGVWGPRTEACVLQAPPQGFGNLPTLRKGLLSSEVGELQLLLREALDLRPDQLAADEHFGSETFKAVVQFQEQHPELAPDGVAGPATIAKLEDVTGKKLVVR